MNDDPAQDDRGRKLIVHGLHWEAVEHEVIDAFQQFGTVERAIVKTDPITGRSRGFAFVTFSTVEAAQSAVQFGSQLEIRGKRVTPEMAVPKGEMPFRFASSAPSNRIFVAKLGPGVTAASLSEYFARFGTVVDSYVPTNQDGSGRGIAFITFEDPSAVEQVMQTEHQVDGKPLVVDRAAPKGAQASYYGQGHVPRGGYAPNTHYQQPVSRIVDSDAMPINDVACRIFVGKLPPTTTTASLSAHFGQFGALIDVYMPTFHGSAQSRGIAFITFGDRSAVDNVMRHDHELAGRPIVVDRAAPKEATRAHNVRIGYNGQHQGYVEPSRYFHRQEYPRRGYSSYERDPSGSRRPRPGFHPYAR
eukprot:TRINITY_DN57010_c0_g1_i1.p1 TRINITY_DN57010_c0_g1~~TRINITY_DN57010_c0_g1_i1.p1  ORF type:complete len:369 (-),score=24.63 TRINITY_DN57010_c0_g1_i1:87-1166(-)